MDESKDPIEGFAEDAIETALVESGDEVAGHDWQADGSEGFEERVERVVSEAGNFMARNIEEDPEANDSDKLWSLFAYLSQVVVPIVVPVIMLLLEPNRDRPFQRYHAVQSLGFLVAAFVYEILAGIVFSVLTAVTLGCLAAVLWILFLLPVVPAVYYAYLAYEGKRFEMPYLTKFMREQNWL
jgi:uncharacterized membrane protein